MNNQQNKQLSKNYLETKLARVICVLLITNKYKYDLHKLSEFIKKNRSYFPDITDSELAQISSANPVDLVDDPDHKEDIPVFASLNHENNK